VAADQEEKFHENPRILKGQTKRQIKKITSTDHTFLDISVVLSLGLPF